MRLGPLVVFLLALDPTAARAQGRDTLSPGTTVSGMVRDSIGRTWLAGALVQLVSAEGDADFIRTATSDPLGRYVLSGVPDGRYRIGFLHAMLDSLGIAPSLREVTVTGQRPVRADLAIPSPARLRTAICGAQGAADSGAVLIGVVRDARERLPVGGATVTGQWMEISFTAAGISRRTPNLKATTGENGWFAMCNVPRGGTMMLVAARGGDSTDVIEVQVGGDGFARRDLYLGAARTVVVRVAPAAGDTMAPLQRRVQSGAGRVSGTVVSAPEGRPLAGAQVRIADGPQTRANERGEWTLVDAPEGTRMLEVRAVGAYPDRRPVDVVADGPGVRVALSSLKAVLDTVRVTANRLYDRHRSGFEARRRTGQGRYLTAEDIARRGAINTSDLFRSMPGIRMDMAATGFDRIIQMRGLMEDWCSPALYLDGHVVQSFSIDDVDSWIAPDRIAGIEVYASGMVPGQYQRMDACGAVVIWTK